MIKITSRLFFLSLLIIFFSCKDSLIEKDSAYSNLFQSNSYPSNNSRYYENHRQLLEMEKKIEDFIGQLNLFWRAYSRDNSQKAHCTYEEFELLLSSVFANLFPDKLLFYKELSNNLNALFDLHKSLATKCENSTKENLQVSTIREIISGLQRLIILSDKRIKELKTALLNVMDNLNPFIGEQVLFLEKEETINLLATLGYYANGLLQRAKQGDRYFVYPILIELQKILKNNNDIDPQNREFIKKLIVEIKTRIRIAIIENSSNLEPESSKPLALRPVSLSKANNNQALFRRIDLGYKKIDFRTIQVFYNYNKDNKFAPETKNKEQKASTTELSKINPHKELPKSPIRPYLGKWMRIIPKGAKPKKAIQNFCKELVEDFLGSLL